MKLKKSILLHGIVLFILILVSLSIGRYNIEFKEVIKTLFNMDTSSQDFNLLMNIRIPRVLLVVIGGGALALSGMVFQSIFQNPLISPDVLGVTSGCSLGAVVAIVLFSSSTILLQVMSFIFGIGAVIFSMLLSKNMKSNKVLALVISGIVTGAIASAFIMIFKYFADPYKELPAIDFWLMGGFYNSSWSKVVIVFILTLISSLVLFLVRWQLKVLTMGDTQAKLLGVNVNGIRIVAILAATLLVSAVVSVAGVVSWIGILAPHIVKSYSKDDISKIMPTTLLMGGILMVIADTIARTISTTEIPISILTSLVGAPFLVYLLCRKKGLV